MPVMATKRALDLRTQILNELNKRSYRPMELFQQFQSFEIGESALKDALAALLEADEIELSSDRHIKLREHRSSAGAVRKAR